MTHHRTPDWQLLEAEYPRAMDLLFSTISASSVVRNKLYYRRGGELVEYNYRDMVDFFDRYDIEYTIETSAPQEYICYTADFTNDHYNSDTFSCRKDAEMFAIDKCLSYIEERLKNE